MLERNYRPATALAAAVVIAACTYNEYHNTYIQGGDPDAGEPVGVAGSAGTGNTAGSAGSGLGGSSGAGQGGAAGASAAQACTGCLQLAMPASPTRALELAFASQQDLSSSLVTWRVRVTGFTGDVVVQTFGTSAGSDTEVFGLSAVTLTGGGDWQDVGVDLSSLSGFIPPVLYADSGVAGAYFDPGFPFDKARVETLGMFIQPQVQSGVFTPLTLEIDSLSVSGHAELSNTFTSDDAGIDLSDRSSTSTSGATLTHVDG